MLPRRPCVPAQCQPLMPGPSDNRVTIDLHGLNGHTDHVSDLTLLTIMGSARSRLSDLLVRSFA